MIFFRQTNKLLGNISYKLMHHTKSDPLPVAPFGTILGSFEGVEAYSCDYDSIREPLSADDYVMNVNGIYTGHKYQCVEYARRYLLKTKGIIFESIPMAYDIFQLKAVKRVEDGTFFKFSPYLNGNSKAPLKGDLLIWKPVGEFKVTGHVAVISSVCDTHVDIVEQNVDDTVWPEGQNYSRRLKLHVDSVGKYSIHPLYGDALILGWMRAEMDVRVDKCVWNYLLILERIRMHIQLH
jgi:glutathionylspermidine amidase/synthetase